MELVFEDPPCNIDDVIKLSYSFDNLHKFLNFLLLKDKESFTKLHNIGIKIREIDDLRTNLDEVTIRVTKSEGKYTEIEKTINSFFQKFNELDTKIVGAFLRINTFGEEIKGFNTRLTNQEENINNLNRLTEENIKTIFKQSETLEKLRNTNEILLERTDKQEKAILQIQNELLKFNEVEKNIRENSYRIEENTKNLSDYQYYSNKKFSDIDNNILNFIETLNEINRQMEKKGAGNVNMGNLFAASQANQETSQAQLQAEMGKSAKEIENIKRIFREFNEKFEKLSKTSFSLEQQVREIKKQTTALSSEIQRRSNSDNSNAMVSTSGEKDALKAGEDANNFASLHDNMQIETDSLRQNVEIIFDRMKKFQEYFKTITTNLGQKTEKSEFEKLSRLVNSELEKLNKKITEANSNSDARLKSFAAANRKKSENSEFTDAENNIESAISLKNVKEHSSTRAPALGKNAQRLSANLSNGEGFEFDQGIINMTKALVERELQSKDEFVKMLQFMDEFRAKGESNNADIDKLFESVVDIRSSLNAGALMEEKLFSLQDQISDVDLSLKKQKLAFEERFKNLEGEPTPDEGSNNSDNAAGSGSIKDNIKNLNVSCKTLLEKIEKVTLRQDNMNSEILTRVKKDLSAESAKILTDFKGDLKYSITLIEEQLREKVDKFSLDEFGKYVNEKLSNEMNKKLDRSDMKRNNNLINKKIDTLENKISKTLVDTLIDLQMEEAPLIVKKPLGAQTREKCASCNQIVLNSIINEEGFGEAENPNVSGYYGTNKHNMTVMPQKFKFKNVQESCYKFGAGSYSRYLSSIDNVNDDLRYNKSVQLPEINSNKGNPRKIVIGGNIGFSSNNVNESKVKNKILGEFTEKTFNSMINEELEKKIINPENLIKTANKLYETVEKEKKNNINSSNFLNK